jgi:hypothetical protein
VELTGIRTIIKASEAAMMKGISGLVNAKGLPINQRINNTKAKVMHPSSNKTTIIVMVDIHNSNIIRLLSKMLIIMNRTMITKHNIQNIRKSNITRKISIMMKALKELLKAAIDKYTTKRVKVLNHNIQKNTRIIRTIVKTIVGEIRVSNTNLRSQVKRRMKRLM